MLKSLIYLFCWTLIPGLELRASIPVGILTPSFAEQVSWPLVVVFCWFANVLIGWVFFALLRPLELVIRKVSFVNTLFTKYLERAREKLRPGLEKYGIWGFALFIGIPLPLTGAYTGAAGAYALGMKKHDFIIANVIGVTIAAIAVTVVVLLIRAGIESPLFELLIKRQQ